MLLRNGRIEEQYIEPNEQGGPNGKLAGGFEAFEPYLRHAPWGTLLAS